ncbi:MAG: CCC motif membrane protein [Bacteroidota bacterium]
MEELIDGGSFGNKPVPNATAVLVLGIVSIIGCFCYGIIGLICGIIALILASQAMKEVNQSPESYDKGQLGNLKAGKVCAIIGLSLSALYLLFILLMIILGAGLDPDSMREFFKQ